MSEVSSKCKSVLHKSLYINWIKCQVISDFSFVRFVIKEYKEP